MIVDSAERQKALDISQSFIVQAPAGSGKTELLTRRFLALLAHCQIPENILAITFTRKAAAEMKQRVISALTKSHTDIELDTLCQAVLKQNAQRGWNLLNNPHRLHITTIDAFCFSLLQKTPLLSRSGTNVNISSQAIELYRSAVDNFFNDFFRHPQPENHVLAPLLDYLDNQIERAKSLLIDMLAKRDAWLSLIVALKKHTNLRHILEKNLQTVTLDRLTELKQLLVQKKLEPVLIELIQFASQHTQHPISLWKELSHFPMVSIETKTQWQALADWLLTEQFTLRQTVDKRLGFPSKDATKNKEEKIFYIEKKQQMLNLLQDISQHDDLIELLQLVKQLPPHHYSESEWQTICILLDILPQLVAHLELTFFEHKEMDFCEVATRASYALDNDDQHNSIAYELYQRIQHILVDEFQDTSVSQMQLVKKLMTEWQPGDGRTLFLVGDPMQSIYRFRQAEVGLFLQIQENSLPILNITPLSLKSNFRSGKEIIHWINQTFNKIFPSFTDFSIGAVPYIQAESTRDISEAGVTIDIEALSNEEEAEKICSLIREIQNKSPNETIAILFRQRHHIQHLLEKFQLLAIDYQGIELSKLSEKLHILDILSLCKAILFPADPLACFSILRAPWCGLLLNDLLQIKWEHERQTHSILWDTIETIILDNPASQARIKHVTNCMRLAWQRYGREKLSDLLENIWQSLGAKAYLSAQEQLECSRAFTAIAELEKSYPLLTMPVIEQKLKTLYADGDAAQHSSLLQVMTIHKAKGLEFDHVIIPQMDRSAAQHDHELLLWTERISKTNYDLLLAPIKSPGTSYDAIYDYLKKLEQERDLQEARRLFYVACTRAKKQLHLFGCQHKTPKKDSFLHFLSQAMKLELKSEKEDVEEQAVNSEVKLPLIRMTDLTLNKLNFSIPTTIVAKEIDSLQWSNPDDRILGIVIHQILQHISNCGLNNLPITHFTEEKICHLLKQHYFANKKIMPYCHIILVMLEKIYHDPHAQWMFNKQLVSYAELPLTLKNKLAILNIRLDRVFIENDIIWCIDYKTSVPNMNQSLQHFIEEQSNIYSAQLQQYHNVLNTWLKKTVRCGLYFPLIPYFKEIMLENHA